MKAIQVKQHGGPEAMQVVEIPKPSPGPKQALVKIEASGINFIDIYFRTGLYKADLPLTPGSLYLAYFAGPAGAVALLSAAEHADAASLMAAADATGRTTRQKLVRTNPFLELLTVGDLKNWADHRMRGI